LTSRAERSTPVLRFIKADKPMEFFQYKNRLTPAKGRLLISEPYLGDPNFERTIILLCEHNTEGSFGFVLNRPAEPMVGDVVEDLRKINAPVYIGGPVQQDTLHYVHRIGDLAEAIPVGEGIFWGGNFEQLVSWIDLGKVTTPDIRFFLGYSGWSPGQLDEEMGAQSWIVSNNLSRDSLFDMPSAAMWQEVLRQLGGRFRMYSNYPADPRLN
jgi:putative transcriptional regulator